MDNGNYSEPQDGRVPVGGGSALTAARQRAAANVYPAHISRDGRGDIPGNAPTPSSSLWPALDANSGMLVDIHNGLTQLEDLLLPVMRGAPDGAVQTKRASASSPLVETIEQHGEALVAARERIRSLLSRVDL